MGYPNNGCRLTIHGPPIRGNFTSAQHTLASQQYLTIKEWGIKLPLSAAISDAYYLPDVTSVDKTGAENAMWLATKSLTSVNCDPSEVNMAGKGIVGRIMRIIPTDVDGVTGTLLTQEYTNGVTIGGYYFAYTSWVRDHTCVPVTTTQPIDAAFTGAAMGAVALSASSTNTYSGWKTYSSAVDHFVISYPSTWVLNTKNAPQQEVGYDSATLTSPSGTVLNLYANTGGKGDNCSPAPQDMPFAKGNNCSTVDYLSAENLHLGDLFMPLSTPLEPRFGDAYLVTTHFADKDGKSSYTMGIAEPTTGDTFELNKPVMGGVMPYSWLTLYTDQGQFLPYAYLYASGNSPSFLTSSDATSSGSQPTPEPVR